MKIVLAFDSYKGSLSAVEACAAAAEGIARLPGDADIVHCPLSDGGEGFAEAMRQAGGGEARVVTVNGPLGQSVPAELVLLNDGKTAVVESALACGLGLVPPEQRSPLRTTSYGLGEMLHAAVQAGAREIVVGLGGSATNDGGMGMLTALSWRFLDAHGNELPPIGASLDAVARIEPGDRLADVEFVAACDVTNPLYGPSGAAYTFAPQKGASPQEVAALDRGLTHFAQICADFLGHDWSGYPGAGAAGGLGFALLAFLGARYASGSSLAIALSGLDAHLAGADLCFTGEGQTDFQTAYGKLPAAVAARCAQADVPCVCLSGSLGPGWRALYQHGFTAILSTSPAPQPLANALQNAAPALSDAAEAVTRIIRMKPPLQILPLH